MSANAENLKNLFPESNNYDPFNDPIMQRRARTILARLHENKAVEKAVITLLLTGEKGRIHVTYGDGMRLQFCSPEPQFSDRNLNKKD